MTPRRSKQPPQAPKMRSRRSKTIQGAQDASKSDKMPPEQLQGPDESTKDVRKQWIALKTHGESRSRQIHRQGRPRWLQDTSRAPKTRPRATKRPPRAPNKSSKAAPRAPKLSPRASRTAQKPPRQPQERPESVCKRGPGSSKTQLAVQTTVQPLPKKQLQTCDPEVCGGNRYAS